MGTITKTAGDDLTLGGDEGLDLDGTVDVQTTSGSLYIEDDFTAAGDLLAESYVIISDSILTNDEWVNGEFDGVDNQKVETRNAGLRVNTDEYTESDEPYLEKTTDGNLELRSAHSLSLHAHVTVDEGELIINGGISGSGVGLMGNLWSSGDMTLTSNGGGLGVEGNAESESGSVEMTATDSWIRLYSRSWGRDVKAGQDIVLNDDTTVYYSGAILDAGQDVILAFNEDITANYDLTINAGDDIILGAFDPAVPGGTGTAGHVTADGHLILTAVDDIYAHGQLISDYGDIEIYSDDSTTYLYTDLVQASGNVLLNNEVELRGTGGNSNQTIDAVNGTMTANKSLDKTTDGDLTLAGDAGIVLGGNVETTKGHLTFEDAVTANGNYHPNQEFNANGKYKKLKAYSIITKTDENGGGDLALNGGYRAGYEIELGGNVTVEDGSLTLGNSSWLSGGYDDATVVADGKLEASEDITAYGDLNGEGALTVKADDDITLHGDVDAAGNLILKADADTIDDESGAVAGGNMTVHGDITTTNGGSIEIYSSDSTTEVHGDIDSDSYVLLNNNAIVGGDITAVTDVTANGTLTLNGTWWFLGKDQTIDAGGMLQLNNTTTKTTWGDLTLLSGDQGEDSMYTEDVTVEHGRLTARAHGRLMLNGDIWSKDKMTLTSNSDGITGPGSESDVLKAYGTLTTGSSHADIEITAENSGIYLYGDVDAGRDLLLNNSTYTSSAGLTLEAGRDVKTYGHLQGGGDLLVEAGRNIEFGGNVNVIGRLEAYSGLSDESGFWFWYDSGAGSIEADGSVIADTMLLEAGAGLPGYSDSHVSVDGLLQTTGGDMVVEAHHDILLGGNVNSAGNLELNADRHGDYGYPDHVYGGDVKVTGTVDAVVNIDMLGNNIELWDDVEAGGNIILTADTSSDFEDPLPEGDVTAYGNITSTGGSIEIYSSDDTTYLGSDVTAYDSVLLNNKTELIGSGKQRVEATTGTLTANRDVDKTTDGDLELAGASGIYLGDDVSTEDGDLIFEDAVTANGTGWSRRNQTFDADGDDKKLHAWDTITKTTKGNLTLSGGQGAGYEIDLDGDVTVDDGDLNLGSAWTLLFGDEDTTVYAGGKLKASDDVKVYDDLNGEGNLTIEAGDDIKLHGDVTAAGNLELYASDSTIYLYGDAYATGNILLNANTKFEGWDDQYVDAGGTLTASGYLRKLNKFLWWKSDGSLYLHADGDISLAGYVQAADELSCYCCGHDECGISS